MKRPRFFKRFWSNRAPKLGSKAKPIPKLYRPFRAPKSLSDMLFIKPWKGYNRRDLLTILRHWPLRTDYLVLQRHSVFSPPFWGSFRSLQWFLHSRYPGKSKKGTYAALSLSLSPGNLPLLDMAWEEKPSGTPITYKEFSFAPLEGVKTPLERRRPSQSSPATGRKDGEFPLNRRILSFFHRLVKGKISPKPKVAKSLSKAEKLTQERGFTPSSEIKGMGGILPKLKAKILPKGMIRPRGVQRGLRKPPEPDRERGLHQGQKNSGISTASTHQGGWGEKMYKVIGRVLPPGRRRSIVLGGGEKKVTSVGSSGLEIGEEKREKVTSRPRPSTQRQPLTTRGEETIPPAKRPLHPDSITLKEEFQEIEGVTKQEMGPKGVFSQRKLSQSSPERLLQTSILSGLRTSLWAKRFLARMYPKIHLSTRREVAPKLGKKEKDEAGYHFAVVKSPKGYKKELVTEREDPSSPFSTPELEPTKAENSVLTRLYSRYRELVKRATRGKSMGVYEGLRSSELGGETYRVADKAVRPEPTKSPPGGKILAKLQLKGGISQKGLNKKAGLDQISAASIALPQGKPGLSAPLIGDSSSSQPMTGSIFQATQAAFKALTQEPGIPLDMGIRQKFESFFGLGLDEVRVHSGAAAAKVTGGLGAEAATIGSHIFLSPAVSQAHTRENIGLLAHELTHVVQGRSIKTPESLVSGKSKDGRSSKYPSESETSFYSISTKVQDQKKKIPPLMAAPLQRVTSAPSAPGVTAQITGVSPSIPEEERSEENLEEMAHLVYERIRRRLQNEVERLPD